MKTRREFLRLISIAGALAPTTLLQKFLPRKTAEERFGESIYRQIKGICESGQFDIMIWDNEPVNFQGERCRFVQLWLKGDEEKPSYEWYHPYPH